MRKQPKQTAEQIEDAAIAANLKNKALYKSLEVAAEELWNRTGNDQAWQSVVSAHTNAADTYKWNEDHPDFWACALESIQGSIDGNCYDTDFLYPWFKAHGHLI